MKIRQRQRWEQNQDFPTTPSFPLSLSPYLGADGDVSQCWEEGRMKIRQRQRWKQNQD